MVQFDFYEKTVSEVPQIEEIQTEMMPERITGFPVLDIEIARQHFSKYLEKIDMMVGEAESLAVDSEATNEAATFLGTSAKQILKKIDEERKLYIDEPNLYVKSVNTFVKIFTDKLEGVERMMKQKIASYRAIQEQRRREKELAQKKATEELQKRLDEEAKQKGIESVKILVPAIPKEPPITRTETGSSHGRKHWTFSVEEPHFFRQLTKDLSMQWEKHLMAIRKLSGGAAIPVPTREISESIKQIEAVAPYLVISDTEIRKVIKAGIREIVPAIKIYQEDKTTFRT